MVELTWQGKYETGGKRIAPLRLALPFQTVETVNESAQQRQMALDLFSAGPPRRMTQPPGLGQQARGLAHANNAYRHGSW